jgi:hypothetical protein
MAKGRRSHKVLVNQAARRQKFGIPLQQKQLAEIVTRMDENLRRQHVDSMDAGPADETVAAAPVVASSDAVMGGTAEEAKSRPPISARKKIEKKKKAKKDSLAHIKDKKKRYSKQF